MFNIVHDGQPSEMRPLTHQVKGIKASFVNAKTKPKKRKRMLAIIKLNQNKQSMLSYSTGLIVSDQRAYSLHSPLLSQLSKQDGFFLIENEKLGIVATGATELEAQQEFARKFDFIYQQYNSLSDEQLTLRVKGIKVILNTIVKEINLK